MRIRLLAETRWSQLIDTTLEILTRVPGYDVVVDDVAAAAGISRSLIYRYFSGLDDLLQHAHRRFFETLSAELAAVHDNDRHPLDQLHAVIATTVHFAAASPATFCNLVDGGLPPTDDDGPLTTSIQLLAPSLRPGCDEVLVARATSGLVEAGVVSWLRHGRTDAKATIDLLFSLAASGLAGDGPATTRATGPTNRLGRVADSPPDGAAPLRLVAGARPASTAPAGAHR